MFGWIMGLLVTSFIMRFGQRIQVLAWSVVWVIQPFSCVFYPLSALPAWAAKVAVLMPTTHVFEAMRAAFAGNPVNYTSLWHSLIISVVLFIIMAVFLESSIKKARKTGLLAKGD